MSTKKKDQLINIVNKFLTTGDFFLTVDKKSNKALMIDNQSFK